MAISSDDWRTAEKDEGRTVTIDEARSYLDVVLDHKMGIRMWDEKTGKWYIMSIPSLPGNRT